MAFKKYLFYLIIIFICILLNPWLFAYEPPDTISTVNNDSIKIVILPFDEIITDTLNTYTWLEEDIVRMLNTELSKFRNLNIKILLRNKLAVLGLEKELKNVNQNKRNILSDYVKEIVDEVIKEDEVKYANYLIIGSFRVIKEEMRIDAQLIDLHTTNIITSVPINFPISELLDKVTEFGEIIYNSIVSSLKPKENINIVILPLKGKDKDLCKNIFIHLNAELYEIKRKTNIKNLIIRSSFPNQKDLIEKYHNGNVTLADMGIRLASDYLIETEIIGESKQDSSFTINYNIYGLNEKSSHSGNSYKNTNLNNYEKDIEILSKKILTDLGFNEFINMFDNMDTDEKNKLSNINVTPFEILRNGIVLYENEKLEEAEKVLFKAATYNETSEMANYYISLIKGKQKNYFDKFKYQYKSVVGSRFYLNFEVCYLPLSLKTRLISNSDIKYNLLNTKTYFYLPKFQIGYKLIPNLTINLALGFWFKNYPGASNEPFEYQTSGTIHNININETINDYSDFNYSFQIYHNYLQEYDFSIIYFFLPELSERETIPFLKIGLRHTRITPYFEGHYKFNNDEYTKFQSSDYKKSRKKTKPFASVGIEYYLTQRRPTLFGDLAIYFYGEISKSRRFNLVSKELKEFVTDIELLQVSFTIGLKTSNPLFLKDLLISTIHFITDIF